MRFAYPRHAPVDRRKRIAAAPRPAAAHRETWKLDGGYIAAMMADDEPIHAVAARLRIDF